MYTNRSYLNTIAKFVLLSVICILVSGCGSIYYSTMEKFGKEKRDILIDNVENVQGSQAKAQEEFKDALTKIKELYAFDGGKLETFYNELKDSYAKCDSRAKQIDERINRVQQVANDLFKEWRLEIGQMNDVKLKNSSKRSLNDAKAKYHKLETIMMKSTKGMAPVLTKLKDYTLYLKHNLNAKAVGSLSGEVVSIEKDVERLISDMNMSIKEAEAFITKF
jgi:Protein of unknown function (DUF2959)